MNKVLNRNIKAGSKESNEPRLLGSIVNEVLHGNSPLAIGCRQYIATQENGEDEANQSFKNFFPDTHLSVDLKLITREPGRIPVGTYLDGAITRDGENHFCFFQNDDEKKRKVDEQRNPYVYLGRRINVHRKEDGTVYPTFNRPRYTKDFSFQDFCREAAEELLVVAGLREELTVDN